jgi:hypothetical protein
MTLQHRQLKRCFGTTIFFKKKTNKEVILNFLGDAPTNTYGIVMSSTRKQRREKLNVIVYEVPCFESSDTAYCTTFRSFVATWLRIIIMRRRVLAVPQILHRQILSEPGWPHSMLDLFITTLHLQQ